MLRMARGLGSSSFHVGHLWNRLVRRRVADGSAKTRATHSGTEIAGRGTKPAYRLSASARRCLRLTDSDLLRLGLFLPELEVTKVTNLTALTGHELGRPQTPSFGIGRVRWISLTPTFKERVDGGGVVS